MLHVNYISIKLANVFFYFSFYSFSSPEDLPNPRIEPRFPALQADSLLSEPPVKHKSESDSVSHSVLSDFLQPHGL